MRTEVAALATSFWQINLTLRNATLPTEQHSLIELSHRDEDPDTSVTGYVHSVSLRRILARNCRYFNAIMQTRNSEYCRSMVFSPGKDREFEQAVVSKMPVKLCGVSKVLSKCCLTL